MGCSFEIAKQGNQCGNVNNNSDIINNKNVKNYSSSHQKPTIKVAFSQNEKENTLCTDSASNINSHNTIKDKNQQQQNSKTYRATIEKGIVRNYEEADERETELELQQQLEEREQNEQLYDYNSKSIIKLKTYAANDSNSNTRIDKNNLQISCRHCYPIACHCNNNSTNYSNNNSNKTSNTIPNTNSCCCNNTPVTTSTRSNSCCRRQTQTLHRTTQQYEQQQQLRQSYRNATVAARNIAANMAAACCGSSNNIQEMLLYARNTLTTHLASVSNSLIENINYYSAADTAVALLKRKKQQQQRHHQHHQQHHRNCQHNHRNHHYHQHAPQHHHHLHNHHRRRQQKQKHNPTKNCCLQQQQQQQHGNEQQEHAATTTISATSYSCNIASTTAAAAAAYNYIGHNSISFYAASSVILVLCYLTSTTSAAAANSENTAPLDKHPIQGIDWSKFDESSSDKEILDLLLEKKRYDKRLLPPVNDEDFCCGLSSPDTVINTNIRRPHNRGTLTVNVNVLLLSLASPDESSLKYEVEFLLNQQWNDPRLQYGNKSHYDFLNALHHHDSIWTPDTYFIMHGDFKDPIIPMHFALRIYRNGTITYAMRRHLILSCQGSLHIFPFDDPKCSFSMESISYEEAQIKYVWKNDEDTLRKSPSLTTLNAYLIKNQTTACDQNSWRGNYSCLRVDLIFTRDRAFYFTTVFIPGIILVTSSFITFWLEWNAVPARSMIGNYSCLQVELTFTRDRAYYFTTVFIPGIILVTSSFITFWLEWNAVPARVMIGVTTMLNFFTTSNGFRSTLPVVSNLTAMNVWDGVCMCFIYASLLEFVCVNYVGRKRPLHNVVYRPGENPVTQRLPAVLSRIGVILASPLEIIEREFHAALSSEKAAAGTSTAGTSIAVTPGISTPASMQTTTAATTLTAASATRIRWEEQHGGIIGAAVQNLRARSIKRKSNNDTVRTASQARAQTQTQSTSNEPIYTEPIFAEAMKADVATTTMTTSTTVTVEDDSPAAMEDVAPSTSGGGLQLRRSHSMSTNTPPLIVVRGENTRVDVDQHSLAMANGGSVVANGNQRKLSADIEMTERQLPLKPPRKKTSRSTSPAAIYEAMQQREGMMGSAAATGNGFGIGAASPETGEKRRDAGAPNEIVACTTCGGSSSPCTHSANNGCATETCFVQVRKKEPPHPIRVAKTIDVIARITFPTAYAIFLIFFFVHYKGFS